MLFGYILSSAMQVAPYHELLAVLSSLTEVVLINCSSKKKGQIICNVNFPFEPSLITLGATHVAGKVGNSITFFRWLKEKVLIPGGEEVNKIDYECAIKKM